MSGMNGVSGMLATTLLPSPLVTYASHLLLAASAAGLIYGFRAALGRYFSLLIRRVDADGDRKDARDLALIGAAAGGLVFLVLAFIGLPTSADLPAAVITALVAPRIVKKRRQSRYVREFDAALAESLGTVASSLKAGLTLKDSLFVACDNSPPAFAREVSLALKEYRFGLPIEAALDKLRRRVKTPNCNIAFGSMIISSRLGGRLPDMLKQIVRTIRERERVEGKLKSLTAQGRAQAFLLCSAPPVLGIGMYLYDRSKMELLTDYWVGQILLCLAIVLEVVGIFVTAQVVKLEV
jgi:tight adherence protein B